MTADDWGRALATLMAALRPDWDIPGCRGAIHAARHRGTPVEVAHAALALTERDDLRTPAVLPQDGPHWGRSGTPTRDDHRYARCGQPGHTSYPAWNCSACRAEQIGSNTGPADPPTWSPDQAQTNIHGAALVRAALRPATHPQEES